MPFFLFLTGESLFRQIGRAGVKSSMFNSIFYTDDGTFRLESFKETIGEIEYLYEYGPKPGEALLKITDSSGYLFAMIKKTTSGLNTILVRELEADNLKRRANEYWLVMYSESEILDWMIQRYPRVAERMIWNLGQTD